MCLTWGKPLLPKYELQELQLGSGESTKHHRNLIYHTCPPGKLSIDNLTSTKVLDNFPYGQLDEYQPTRQLPVRDRKSMQVDVVGH